MGRRVLRITRWERRFSTSLFYEMQNKEKIFNKNIFLLQMFAHSRLVVSILKFPEIIVNSIFRLKQGLNEGS